MQNYQSLFKKWNTVELVLSISRTIVTVGLLVFLYFKIKKGEDDLNNIDDNSLIHSNIFIIFLIVISGIWIIIRALALTANDDIGLYEDGEQNAFEEKIAINYIFDIIEIILYGISICFVLRIKRPSPTPNVIQSPVHLAPHNPVRPPQNPYPIQLAQPRPNGRPRLLPIRHEQVEVIERRHISREITAR